MSVCLKQHNQEVEIIDDDFIEHEHLKLKLDKEVIVKNLKNSQEVNIIDEEIR